MGRNKKTVEKPERRAGARLNDGVLDGSVIAVSGDDIAIRWDNGTVQQLKVSELSKYHGGVKAPLKPS